MNKIKDLCNARDVFLGAAALSAAGSMALLDGQVGIASWALIIMSAGFVFMSALVGDDK